MLTCLFWKFETFVIFWPLDVDFAQIIFSLLSSLQNLRLPVFNTTTYGDVEILVLRYLSSVLI